MPELVELECSWCQGTGDWNHGRSNSEEGSCEICGGTGKVDDISPKLDLDTCVLSDLDVKQFAELWCSPHKNLNLGGFIRRIAVFTQNKIKESE